MLMNVTDMMNQKTEGVADRACELFRESEYEIKVTKFLTPQERIIVRDTLRSVAGKSSERCFFFGGCRGTERCTAVFLPEWLFDSPAFEDLPSDERLKEEFFAEYLASEAGSDLLCDIPFAVHSRYVYLIMMKSNVDEGYG